MYNKGVNSMLMYVLSLVLCALFGALAAVYVGYRYQYTKSGDEVWYDVSTAFIVVAICVIACFGPLDELPLDGQSVSGDIFIVSVITVMIWYQKFLIHCAIWGEDLRYPPSVRKRLRRERKTKKQVITTKAIARAIRIARAQEEAENYENELERVSFLVDGLELIILKAEDDINKTA